MPIEMEKGATVSRGGLRAGRCLCLAVKATSQLRARDAEAFPLSAPAIADAGFSVAEERLNMAKARLIAGYPCSDIAI